MSGKEPHFAVKFAARYRDPTVDYLNAWTALSRLDELIEDARALKGHFDTVTPLEHRWHPWVGAEIVSFYAVGYVTCLEWHARSRLVDLLTFKPAAVKPDDVKVLKDKVVLDMLVSNVTVASVVGAAINISSLEEYMGVFSRLFCTFDSGFDSFKAIKAERPGTGKPWVEEQEIEDLKNLYSFRNNLVHEIGIDRVGHWNVRDRLDPEAAIVMGELVDRTMRAIEASVSAKAPPSFPNILGDDGFPIAEWERLENELPVLEDQIARIVSEFEEHAASTNEKWQAARAAADEYIAGEKAFLESAAMLHHRYIEMRDPPKLALIKSRHAYLTSIIETVGGAWEIDEA